MICEWNLSSVYGQDVTETVGFGQASDSPKEGESGVIRIRLEPVPVTINVSGQVVPLTLAQFKNYTFTTPRTVPESVQMIIDDITDPADRKLPTSSFDKLTALRPSFVPYILWLLCLTQLQAPSLSSVNTTAKYCALHILISHTNRCLC